MDVFGPRQNEGKEPQGQHCVNQSEMRRINGKLKGIAHQQRIPAHPLCIKSSDGNQKYCANQKSVVCSSIIPHELEQDPSGHGDGRADEKQVPEDIKGQRQSLLAISACSASPSKLKCSTISIMSPRPDSAASVRKP